MAAVANGNVKHYNDWPNTQGFDVKYEELTPTELEVQGNIPAYVSGVLFRNGVGPREFNTAKEGKVYKLNHWFDALAQVHRFEIHAPTPENPKGRVTHNSRRTSDGLIEQIVKTGSQDGFSFAQKYDPCTSVFSKLQSTFRGTPKEVTDNVNVSVILSTNFPGYTKNGQQKSGSHSSAKIETLCNRTDNTNIQMIDPETLEPIGLAKQEVLHPSLKGPVSAAHSKVCPVTGDTYNFNLDFGRQGCYRVFHVSNSTGKTDILATIYTTPAYLHSFFMTEHYVVLCIWNSHFGTGGASLLWTRNYLDAMKTFDTSKPALWYIVDRTPTDQGGKGLVATYESSAFFCFHTVNAWEETDTKTGTTSIYADFCAYDSLDVMYRYFLANILSDSPKAKAYADPSNMSTRAAFRRVKLPSLPSKPNKKPLKTETIFNRHDGRAPELPSLNHSYRCKPYRYAYGVTDTGKSTFFDGLVKIDTTDLDNPKVWSHFGQSAGEPIFVADPDSTDEDGGVLLTVVLDGTKGKSYLLVLDAKTMKEVGRANVDGVVGFGFHGVHVRNGVQSGCVS